MSFWTGRRTLVTGGTGFIGSHLVERLLDEGAAVRVVGRDPARLDQMIGRRAAAVEFLTGDLRVPDVAHRACQGMDAVFHLAGRIAGAGYNSAHPGTSFTDNVAIGLHLLDGAVRAGVERVLCVSSACVYRRHCTVPTPESEGFVDDPDEANFGYGWAKRALEVQARSYAKEYPIKVGIVRPYNAYGPRDNFDWETSHVIPALIRKVVEGQDPLIVWGDGSQSRSFLYVSDFVEGLLLALERYPVCDPVNIGTDEEIAVADLVRLIIELAGSRVRVQFDPTRPSGQPRRNGDFSRARTLLSFQPKVRLTEGLKTTIDWYLAQRNHVR
ncbi:MAG: NAD-dependent epimerase/dehydratase family protein [Candidatus Latescibacteria bacterium]|nr:NAD-dependent epimerase/dehydratase family protein [Candidatus Latescibacterota bacterium]